MGEYDALQGWREALVDDKLAAKYVEEIDVTSLERSEAIVLLGEMLLTMYEEGIMGNDFILDTLLGAFGSIMEPFTEEVTMSTYLPALAGFNSTAASYVLMSKNLSIRDVIIDLIKWLPGYRAPFTMSLVVRLYTRQDQSRPYDIVYNPSDGRRLSDMYDARAIGFMMDVADRKGNVGIWNWLRKEYARVGPLVGPGPWMIWGETPRALMPIRSYIDVSPYEVVSELISAIGAVREEDYETVVSTSEADFRVATAQTKLEVYKFKDTRYSEAVQARRLPYTAEELEIELFKLYGPSNPFYGGKADLGDDRMLLCKYYDYDEEVDDYVSYTGSCDWKGHKMTNKRCGLRLPMPSGGWQGWYCSAVCVREKLEDMRGGDSHTADHVDAMETMFDTILKQIVDIGIYHEEPVQATPAKRQRTVSPLRSSRE